MFDAEKVYNETYDLLHTNDQSGGKYAGSLNLIGKAFRVAGALGETFGVVGGRR